jgi:heme/copper-type cytochrome/quinol oxidase subunit 3
VIGKKKPRVSTLKITHMKHFSCFLHILSSAHLLLPTNYTKLQQVEALEKQKKNKRKTQKQLSLLSAQFILSVCLVFAYALACLIERSVNQCEGTPLSASRVSFLFFFFFCPNVFRGGCMFLVAKFRAPKGRIRRPLGCL